MSSQREIGRKIRSKRVRRSLFANSERPRLSVFRSNKHLYAQIIDDEKRETLVAVSTLSKEFKNQEKIKKSESAQQIGKLIGKKALEKNIKQVCFDRGPYLYHGRIKTLADAARAEGLKF